MQKKKPTTKQSKDEVLEDLANGVPKYLEQIKNCAQSTFAVLKAHFELGDDGDAIFQALSAFPGVAGRAETCGACSGSMIALGLVFGQQGFEQARLFCEGFELENGSTQCGEILASNLGRIYKFPEDMAAYLEDGGEKICLGVVQKAVCIAGGIIYDHQRET